MRYQMTRITGHARLRRWLEEDGRTRRAFANQLGISTSYLSYLLNGERSPSLALAGRIARRTDDAIPVDVWLQTAVKRAA